MQVSAIAYGGYRRTQVGALDNGWPIVRSFTPTLGAFFWIAVRGADQDWHPFGGRTFDSLRALQSFARYRGL